MVRITQPLYFWEESSTKYVHILASLLLHPGRLTWNLRIHPWKRKIIFQTIIWVFPKILVPQNGWSIMENPIKIHDLGIHLFLETPIFRFKLLIFGGDPSKIILPAPDIILACANGHLLTHPTVQNTRRLESLRRDLTNWCLMVWNMYLRLQVWRHFGYLCWISRRVL